MKALDNLEILLNKMGATLDAPSGSYVFNCDAPKGYVWKATGTTALCYPWDNGSQTWLVKAIKEAKEDLMIGLERLDDENHRAVIENDMDEEWRAPEGSPSFIEWPK